MADPKYISQITLPDNETYNVKDSAAARVSHTHGNLTNDGKITSTATIASGDKLVIVDSDSTAGSKITGSSITFGTSTAQWLNNSGKWSTPSAAQIGAATTNHTHTLSLATDTGTSSTTLAHGGKYKLTAGGNSVIFTLPSDNNTTYTISSSTNNGQITVTPSSGDAYNVSVTGLGSAAYTSAGAYASSGHTHTTTIADAASGDTNQKTLAFGGKYKLTAGGTNYIFTMPSNPNTNTTYTISSGDSSGEIKVTPSTENAYNVKVKDINTAAYRGVDSSIGAASTSTNLPTSAAVASFVEGKGYVTSSGVTQITAGSGLSGGTITTTGTISIATGGVSNDMLAGSIANGKLANSAISIAGTSVSLGGTLAADTLRTNLGLSNALHFRGIATVAITDGSTTNPTISGYDFSKKEAGDVIIDKDSAYEFIWSGSKWERLGPDGSYKPLQTAVTDTNASTSATTTFVQAVTQDANGVITVTKAPLNTSGTWSGNAVTATSATTATNLANKPSLAASGNNITVTAGGKTSDAFTVPYATTAGAVAWTNVNNRPTKITLTGAVTGNVSLGSGELTLATTVNHNHDSAYLKLNGSNNMTADVNIIAGDTDKFVNYWYNTNKIAGASWRAGMLGTGSNDTNYYTIQSGTSNTSTTTWSTALQIGQNTLDSGFGGNVYPISNNTKTLGTVNNKWLNVYATEFIGDIRTNHIIPMTTKTYTTTLYNSSSGDGYYQIFGNITPTNYNELWTVTYRLTFTAADHLDYTAIYDVFLSGRSNTYYAWRSYNSIVNYPIYSHVYLAANSSGTAHELGFRIASSYGAESVAKTVKVELLEQNNCTVTLLNSLKSYTSATPSGYTWRTWNATSAGMQETGDNDANGLYIYSNGFRMTVGSNKIQASSLFGQISDGTYESFIIENNAYNNTAKTKNPHGFLPNEKIYWNSGSQINAGIGSVSPYEQYHSIDYRYTFNITSTGIPASAYTFIKFTYNVSTGLLYLADDWFATALPTTNDGYIYQRIGSNYYNSADYRGSLLLNNPYYKYENNGIQVWHPTSVHNHDSAYVAKSAGVTNVAWDSTNNKITKTINGTTSDVVTIATLKSALGNMPPDTHNHNTLYLTAIGYDKSTKKIYYTKNGSNTNILEFAAGNNISLSAEDNKLTITNTYTHPTGDGNKHVPANGTGNNGKFLKATATAGTYEWANAVTSITPGNGLINGTSGTSQTAITTTGTISIKEGGVTNAMLAGSIANNKLANSSITVGNKGISLGSSGTIDQIMLSSTTIGTNTSWDITNSGFYYVASSSNFTGEQNPGTNQEMPYTYGGLYVMHAGNGGAAQFYISHNASNTKSKANGIRYRSGWNVVNHTRENNTTPWISWATILDDKNYNLFVPTLTGIGASGTWSISITGNASGTASNVTGTVAIANGGTGKTTALDAANALLSGLPAWTADPTDNTVLIRRDTGGSESYGKVTFSTVWNYIKGKADNTYAASGHNHDGAYVAKSAGVTAVTWDNTNKKLTRTINGTAADVVTFAAGTNIGITSSSGTVTIANTYSVPLAANGTRGGIQIGYTTTGNNYAVQLSSEKAYVSVPWTDTKVTAVGNHYAPSADSNAALSASATGATAAWSIDVVKAVQLQRDAKGHVTGVTVTSGKIPANPNTDTKQNITLATTSKAFITGVTTTPTSTAQALVGVADTGVYLTTTAGEISALRHSWHDPSNSPVEKAYSYWNPNNQSIDFVFN